MRRLTAVLALAVAAAACSGDAAPVTTVDPTSREAAAAEYAVSALRALDGTDAAGMTAADVSDLVLEACDRVDGGATAAAAATEVAAPTADPALLGEVVEVGVGLVCPDEPPTAIDLIVQYEASVNLALASAGIPLPEDAVGVLQAGPVTCDAFFTGGSAEQALLAAAGTLFDVPAASFDDLRSLTREEGILLGAVVASATAILCPEHDAAMREYLAGL